MTLGLVISTELLKLRRSRVTVPAWLAISAMPLIGALFMWIAMEPDRAARLGLLGTKAQLAGLTASWPGYFALLLQTVGIGGMILVSVLAAYVFGREYAEDTAKNLLALPIGRHWLVLAKLAVVLVWFAALIAWLVVEGLAVAWLLELPGFAPALVLRAIGDLFLAALVAWLLVPAVAWIATLGRGYLAPLGFTIFMLVLGNVLGATGWGRWFPWSIVPLFAGVAGPRADSITGASLAVLLAAFAAGVAATIGRLRSADEVQ